ncbi:MAG: AAA family ATPase [Fervidobacterium sp.]|nr:AAA family ATPase [Fervidobacterium sp.]
MKRCKREERTKYLPIGISDFKRLIKGEFVYVDKTRYVMK